MLGSAATFGFATPLIRFPRAPSDYWRTMCNRINSFFMSIGTAIRTEPQSAIAMEAFAKARAAPILMARRRAEEGRRV